MMFRMETIVCILIPVCIGGGKERIGESALAGNILSKISGWYDQRQRVFWAGGFLGG